MASEIQNKKSAESLARKIFGGLSRPEQQILRNLATNNSHCGTPFCLRIQEVSAKINKAFIEIENGAEQEISLPAATMLLLVVYGRSLGRKHGK